jgi:hypothetical protein
VSCEDNYLWRAIVCAMAQINGCSPMTFAEIVFEVRSYNDGAGATPAAIKAALVELAFAGEVTSTDVGWALCPYESSLYATTSGGADVKRPTITMSWFRESDWPIWLEIDPNFQPDPIALGTEDASADRRDRGPWHLGRLGRCER